MALRLATFDPSRRVGVEPGCFWARRTCMKTSGILAGVTAALAALAATDCTHGTPPVSQPPAPGHVVRASCLAPRGSVTFRLTDTTPTSRARVEVGGYITVTVPAWHWGTATSINVAKPLLRQLCTVVLPDHGRRTVFKALRPGSSYVGATVEPGSNLAMPAWGGIVLISPASR